MLKRHQAQQHGSETESNLNLVFGCAGALATLTTALIKPKSKYAQIVQNYWRYEMEKVTRLPSWQYRVRASG